MGINEKAQKVWKIAEQNGLSGAVEYCIDDLEAFAGDLDCENEKEVLIALFWKITAICY